jgi:hypothetical protein
MKTARILAILVLGLMVCLAEVSEGTPMGTAFTYQGRLMDKNKPADGLYGFQFKIYDSNDPCTGAQLGSTIDINDLETIDGHFIVELDFGSGIFDGNAVWLETRVVESPLGSDPCTLTPRVELTPTPYAIYAQGAADLTLPYSGTASIDTAAFSVTNTGTGYAGNFEQTGSGNYNGGLNVTTAAGRYGVKILNQGNNIGLTYGLRAEATSTNGWVYGGNFTANSDGVGGTAFGIQCVANNTVETAYGYSYGLKLSSDCTNGLAIGVYSDTKAGGGSTSNVYGINSNNSHDGTAGTSYGMWSRVYGSDTGDSYGTYSEGNKYSSDTAGTAYGGYFIGDNERTAGGSYGVYGEATNSTSILNYGGYFKAAGSEGTGVYGEATDSAGNYTNYGGYFKAAGSEGIGVYGEADNSGDARNYGGYFSASGKSGVGVRGEAYGSSGIGMIGKSSSGWGVYGESVSSFAVYGISDSGYGVYGISHTAYGVYGYSSKDYGVYGESNRSYGVYGKSIRSYGVYGKSSESYAGYFEGNVYVENNVSALSFTDRTPYPKDLATAYRAVMSMERLPEEQYDEMSKETQLDHSMLSDFIRSQDGNRDLSATVSCHNEVLKDLTRKQQELGKAYIYIEQLHRRIEILEDENEKIKISLASIESMLTNLSQ